MFNSNLYKIKILNQTTFWTVLQLCSCAVVQYFVEICVFAILRIHYENLRICDLRTGTPKKFADLQSRNEPKNLRICRFFEKVCLPTSEDL
jgi:hypothetical protein